MECQSEYFTLAGVALGALIGALATLFAARLSWQRFRYNEAAAKFRSAFTHEIYRLRKGNEDVYKILSDDAFEMHEKAKILFEPHLRRRSREKLESAWQEHRQAIRSRAPGNVDQRKIDNQEALERIERLLEVAAAK